MWFLGAAAACTTTARDEAKCNNGHKSSSGDDVHGTSRGILANGGYRTRGSFYSRVKLESRK